MTHPGTQPLTSQRLLLRPFTLDDVADMYQNWAQSPQVTRYLSWPAHPSPEVTENILSDWIQSYEDPTYYQWCIIDKSSGQPIGSVSGQNLSEDGSQIELGYALGEAWWNQGLATEAADLVLTYLLTQTPIQKVIAKYHPDNPASGRVMAKLGMHPGPSAWVTYPLKEERALLSSYQITREEFNCQDLQ